PARFDQSGTFGGFAARTDSEAAGFGHRVSARASPGCRCIFGRLAVATRRDFFVSWSLVSWECFLSACEPTYSETVPERKNHFLPPPRRRREGFRLSTAAIQNCSRFRRFLGQRF